MKKEDKSLLISSLTETLKKYPHFYLVDLTALDSQTTSDLRRECFKQNVKLVMIKNTLFEKALGNIEGDFSSLSSILKGTTGVMFTEVANVPGKLIKSFSKKYNGVPVLKGAYAEESIYIGADQLESLITIKSKNELIAEVVAMLESPINGVLSALDSGASTIHGVLETLEKRGE
ncbi:MAG: 50S ribosomal protein L10 [Bacteroidaceae bacterium]|nr:50S ribosomal protein L10 [Bacteroidaceae bacterium]